MTPLILVVEDNSITALALVNVLRANGFRTVIASSAAGARDSLRTVHPDLILLDVQLPGEDGYELTRELKANPATAAIPIVITTARSLAIDRTLAFEAGCDEFLTKPIQPGQLTPTLRRVLAAARPASTDGGAS